MRTTWMQMVLVFSGFLALRGGGNSNAKHTDMQGHQEPTSNYAGRYYMGDGLGLNRTLVLDRHGRFQFVSSSDDGTEIRVEGSVEIRNSQFLLHSEHVDSESVITGTSPPELNLISWGDRRYLLPKQAFLHFCNSVNLGLEPREKLHGRFYVRADLGDTCNKFPQLPADWNQFLLRKPIHGEVCDITNRDEARVNLGRRDGLRVGMCLVLKEGEFGKAAVYSTVVIISTNEKSCVVKPNAVHAPVFGLKQSVMSEFPKDVIIEEKNVQY